MNNNVISRLASIEIQTVSWCNAHCTVCPWPQIKESVPRQSMTEDIWHKALEGVRALDPDVIMPYMNNEPLLDKKIDSRILDLRAASPRSQIEFSTNGLLLTEKLSEFLVNNADIILISLFGYDEKSNVEMMGKGMSYDKIKNNLLQLKKAREDSGSQCIINIVKIINSPFASNDSVLKDWIFWEDEGISVRYYDFVDRCTNVGDFKQRNHTLQAYGCDYNTPVEDTSILYNGDVIFCSFDWRQEYIMGNLHKDSLFDIVNGDEYNRIRNMVDGVVESDDNFLCKKCANCKTRRLEIKRETGK